MSAQPKQPSRAEKIEEQWEEAYQVLAEIEAHRETNTPWTEMLERQFKDVLDAMEAIHEEDCDPA